MDIKQIIKSCCEATAKDEKTLHLMFRKLGIAYTTDKLPHAMLTISFDEKKLDDREKGGISRLPSLLNNYKWLSNNTFYGTLEYFSKDYPEGGNLHLHILIQRLGETPINKTKVCRDVRSKYRHYIKTCNIQLSNSKEHFNNRLAYIRGQKSQDEFTNLDRVWRTENKILPIYTNGLL